MKQYLKNYSSGNQKGVITILLSVIMLTGIIVAALQITSNSITRMKRGQNTEVALKTQQAATSKRGEILYGVGKLGRSISVPSPYAGPYTGNSDPFYTKGGQGDCATGTWINDTSNGISYCISAVDEANGEYEVRVRQSGSDIVRMARFKLQEQLLPLPNPYEFSPSDFSTHRIVWYGFYTSISGDKVAISAQRNSAASPGVSGTLYGKVYAYVFKNEIWEETMMDFSSLKVSYPNVDVSGNLLAIGMSSLASGGQVTNRLKIYEYNGTSWTQKHDFSQNVSFHRGEAMLKIADQKIIYFPSTFNCQNYFYLFNYTGTWSNAKYSFSIPADWIGISCGIAVNNSLDRFLISSGNKAKVFDYKVSTNSWEEAADFVFDSYSNAVDISGDGKRILVYYYNNTCSPSCPPAIKVFDFKSASNTWEETAVIEPPTKQLSWRAIKISGDGTRIITSAYCSESLCSSQDLIFIYDFIGTKWVKKVADKKVFKTYYSGENSTADYLSISDTDKHDFLVSYLEYADFILGYGYPKSGTVYGYFNAP